jgi:hypothetical protein
LRSQHSAGGGSARRAPSQRCSDAVAPLAGPVDSDCAVSAGTRSRKSGLGTKGSCRSLCLDLRRLRMGRGSARAAGSKATPRAGRECRGSQHLERGSSASSAVRTVANLPGQPLGAGPRARRADSYSAQESALALIIVETQSTDSRAWASPSHATQHVNGQPHLPWRSVALRPHVGCPEHWAVSRKKPVCRQVGTDCVRPQAGFPKDRLSPKCGSRHFAETLRRSCSGGPAAILRPVLHARSSASSPHPLTESAG